MAVKHPEIGICVSAFSEGDALTFDGRVCIGVFTLYDLAGKKVLTSSESMYAEAGLIKLVGAINAIHYALLHGFPYIYTDSAQVWQNIKDQDFKRTEILSDGHKVTVNRAEKGLTWLKSLHYHRGHTIFTDNAGNAVFVRNWLKEWGEIPK